MNKKMVFLIGFVLLVIVARWLYVSHLSIDIRPHCENSSELSDMPKHLGIIMDGNRRWAKQLGKAPWLGHKQGVDPIKAVVKFCLKHKIAYLSLYTLSLENLQRPQEELDYLFNILAHEIESTQMEDLFKNGVRVRFVGDRSQFPTQLIPVIERVEAKTREGKNLTLNLLFCYGGRQEIVAAVRDIARAVESGKLKSSDIGGNRFEEFLWLGKMPQPDLVIRTGKHFRLSNFLTYQSAYSELFFLDCYWPEVTEKHLEDVLAEFVKRTRTFGT